LLFNFCRESSDHGPFNSWDRQPFWTDVPGEATLTPLYNRLHHNFFIANFESSMCVDNDDGSAYYLIHDNVCHGGGHKSDFAGHSKSTFNSLQIAPKKDDCIKVQPSNDVCPEGYYNNSCVMLGVSGSASQAPTYAYVNGCDGAGNVVDAKALPTMHSNRIYNPSGAVRVACALLAPPWNTTSITLKAFQNQGYEVGTTVATTPADEDIIALAKGILLM